MNHRKMVSAVPENEMFFHPALTLKTAVLVCVRICAPCTSIYFKPSEKKTPIDSKNISEKYSQVYKQAARKFALNSKLT